MINIISRKYANSNECKLSLRIKTASINTAIALGLTVSISRWGIINDTLKDVSKAHKRKASVFIDDSLTNKLWDILKTCRAQESVSGITVDYAKFVISKILYVDETINFNSTQKSSQKPTLFDFFETFISEIKSGKRTKMGTNNKLSDSYINTYTAVYKSLVRFSDENHMILDWDDMTFDFLSSYKLFMRKKSVSTNTISLYITLLKSFLNEAKLKKYTTTTDFQSKHFACSKENVDYIALNEAEINKLYNLRITSNISLAHLERDKNVNESEIKKLKNILKYKKHTQELEQVRITFVLACLIGQRFSDFSRVNKTMLTTIKKDTYIYLDQVKTKKGVFIPVNPMILNIINNINFTVKYKRYNEKLRTVCMLAGLTNIPKLEVNACNLKYNTTLRVCDLVSSHTGRRSFATNAYRNGVPLSSIMAVTGHSSEAMLRKYLKIDSKERALQAASDFKKHQKPLLKIAK